MTTSYPGTIVETFNLIEKKYAKKIFVISDRNIKYSMVCNTVRRLAGIFNSLGLKQGDNVVFATQDDMLASILFIALLRTGITSVFLDAETKPRRALRLIELVDPKALIIDEHLIGFWGLKSDAPVIPIRSHNKSLLNRLFRQKTSDNSLHGLIESTSPAELPETVDALTNAYVLFTSGTTSDPKGVCITHHALFSHLNTLSRVYGLTPNSKILNTLILSHADGAIQGPVLTFFNAASWYRPFRFSVQHIEDMLDTIFRENITHFIAVPTILSLLCQFGRALNNSFSNGVYKLTISCGAQLEASLWKEFETIFNNKILNVYGLTETVAGGIFAIPGDDPCQFGTIGKPIDCNARIIDEKACDVKQGEPGELLIKGGNLMSGYFKAPEATNKILKDGWLYTGDIAVLEGNGSYRILGRKKSIIISGGMNIHPGEINEVLNSHSLVCEAETFGETDPTWGERIVSAVVLTEGGNLTETDLINYCRKHLEKKKIPSNIHTLNSMPRGRSGKIRLEALRKVILAMRHKSENDESSSIETRLLELTASCFKVSLDQISMNSSEEGMVEWDSLNHLSLIAEVEKTFSIRFSPIEVINVKTLKDLYQICTKKLGGSF